MDGVRPCLTYLTQALGEATYSDGILCAITEKVKGRLVRIGVASPGCSPIGEGLWLGWAEGADRLPSEQHEEYRGTGRQLGPVARTVPELYQQRKGQPLEGGSSPSPGVQAGAEGSVRGTARGFRS